MKERIVMTTMKFLTSLLGLILLLAQMPAAALPGFGAGAIRKAQQQPANQQVVIHQDSLRELEQLTGQTLSSSEINNLQRISDTVSELNRDNGNYNGITQNVRWDLGSTGYVFTLLICGHGHVNVNQWIPQKALDVVSKVPPFFRDKINNYVNRANVDLMLCKDPHTGLSYVMAGTGAKIAGGNPPALGAGIQVGIYFAPKTEKLVAGSYVYGRAAWSYGAGNIDAITGGADFRCAQGLWDMGTQFKIDFSGCSRAFIATGVNFDFGAGLINKLKALRTGGVQTGNGTSVSLGAWTFSGGVVVNMNEFPWWERMRAGMNIKDVFADMDKYIAANK